MSGRPPPPTGGPPISFKTVPGRHRTQKWNVARQYDYSGDDWGGYDPYDDYGDQPPPPAMPAQYGGPAPQQGYGGLPSQQPTQGMRMRQQSFDEGDERRAFSGPSAPGYMDARGGSPARSAVSNNSSGGRPSGEVPRPSTASRMRDFTNPEQVPPPLNTRASPAPMSGAPMTAPSGAYARGSSGSRGSPAPDVQAQVASTVPTSAKEKELPTPPFIRPSDIYKRMEEAKERERKESLDSNSRPSLDMLDTTRDSSRNRPLSNVYEGEDEAMSASVSGPMDVPHDFGEAQAEKEGGTSSLQATPTNTRPPPGSDPAADILAERTHETPITSFGNDPHGLAHQPSQASSQGFRSAVDRGFDDAALSRDSSQSTKQSGSGDVSRSNTTSTSGISPIMSRAPWNEAMAPPVPTIAEEPAGRYSSESSRGVVRKPSPQQSANASPRPSLDASREAGVEKGYRRSLDPPSSHNSPAHTPGLESGRRLSEGLAAQTVSAEQSEAEAERQALEKTQLEERMGRPRAGTDYSIRESDLAHAVNASPDKGEFSPSTAEAAENEQAMFVKTHSPPAAPGTGFTGPGVGGTESGRSSPNKGRVRELADKYQEIHESSRRGSTASSVGSWENFRGSEENLVGALAGKTAKRQATGNSNMVSESDYGGVEDGGIRDSIVVESPQESQSPALTSGAAPSSQSPAPIDGRPGLPSQQSFRPQLPGGWVSYSNAPSSAGTPGPSASLSPTSGTLSPAAGQDTRQSWFPGDESVDLTPTTRKVPLEGSHSPPQTSNTMFGQAKDAGNALGAALISSVGLGHQTRDFGSSQPAQEVEIPNTDRKLAGETGGLNVPERPGLPRGDTDASAVTTVSNVSVASAGSSRGPTPPAKDTPQPQTGQYDREQNYFSAAIAPLRTGRSREASPEAPAPGPASTGVSYALQSGLQRDDSLRREIVRSLDQDALDAPTNASRVAQGKEALPAREIADDSPTKPQPLRMLDQRFSWEQGPDLGLISNPASSATAATTAPASTAKTATPREEDAPMVVQSETGKEIGAIGGVPRVQYPEDGDSSPEIKPEMPYERPRSRGLQVVNADDSSDEEDIPANRRPWTPERTAAAAGVAGVGVGVGGLLASSAGGPVSPISKSQENLHLRAQQQAHVAQPQRQLSEQDGSLGGEERRTSLREMPPSPLSQGSGSMRLPSYYIQDSSTLGLETAPSPRLPQGEGEVGQEARDLYDSAARNASTSTGDAPEPVATSPRTVVDASIPQPPEKPASAASPTSPVSPTSGKKIPPFREILAIKDSGARIRGYQDTRRNFAEMNTGLNDWLSQMLERSPEYANLSTSAGGMGGVGGRPPIVSTVSGKGHKASPSLAKFTKGFGTSGNEPTRSNTVSTPSASGDGSGGVDMDKLQQRGKDFMKGAGVLGGKAQAGAKGLFAKGKSRFGTQRESRGSGGGGGGGGKVSSPPSASATSPSTRFFMVPAASPPPNTNTSTSTRDLGPASPPAISSPPALSSSTTTASVPSLPPITSSPPLDPNTALNVPGNRNTVASSVYSSHSPILKPAEVADRGLDRPDRSQTQTPGSVSSTSGGVLSRTLSRLREKSRSNSLSSRGSRRGSRPSSLVLLNTNTHSNTNSNSGLGGLERVEDASPRADRGVGVGVGLAAAGVGAAGFESSRRGSEFGMQAISPWSEPDEVQAMGGAERGIDGVSGGVPERLGVLPSPKEDGFSIHRTEQPEEGGRVSEEQTQAALQRAGESEDSWAKNEEGDELYQTTPKKLSPVKKVAEEEDLDATPTAAKYEDRMNIPATADATLEEDMEQSRDGAEVERDPTDDIRPTPKDLPNSEVTDLGAEAAQVSPQEAPLDKDVPTETSAADPLVVPTIAEPTTEWDNRSIVSSNNDFKDAKEENGKAEDQESRRSSVSSLGQDEDFDPQQPVMSSQAVPAGPPPESSTLSPHDQFVNRPYQFGDAQDARSKSYISLGQDSSGAPMQETLDIADKPKHDSVDVSNFGGPPAGAAPFQRQPAVRDISGEARPKRFSGMVKGRRPTLTSPETEAAASAVPGASAMSDQFGLEGLQDDSENVVIGEIPPHRMPPENQEEKKAKRRSGLFDVLKRSGSVTKTERSRDSGVASKLTHSRDSSTLHLESRRSSTANLPKSAIEARPVEIPKSASRTPQRASTTVKEPEQKKKRFSMGSLFGRSSTTGHKSDKPRKLTKQQTPGREASQRQTTDPGPNHEAYAQMRQQQRAEQERYPKTYPPPIPGPPSHGYSLSEGNVFKSPEDMVPPPGGWYGPQQRETQEQQIPQERPPQYRRLHSDNRRDSPFQQVPKAFRPVESSYNGPMRPIGPPEERMYSPPTSPVSQGQPRQNWYPPQSGYEQPRRSSLPPQRGYDQGPAYDQQPSLPSLPPQRGYDADTPYDQRPSYNERPTYGPPRNRFSSYGSNESEVSGQEEWQRSEWRRQSSSPSISPVQSRTGSDPYPPGRNYRVGSITEEMARSPAREYADQQTPWSISLPRPGEGPLQRGIGPSSYGMQEGQGIPPSMGYEDENIGYAQDYPPPGQYQYQRGMPMSPESPYSSRPPPQPLVQHAPFLDERSIRGVAHSQNHHYPSPPTSPESQWYWNRAGLNPPPAQERVYGFADGNEMPPPPRKSSYVQQRMQYRDNGPPPAQSRRMSSGYSGRRDEPTIGEETVEMRGVSYPGQEWTPERWD